MNADILTSYRFAKFFHIVQEILHRLTLQEKGDKKRRRDILEIFPYNAFEYLNVI